MNSYSRRPQKILLCLLALLLLGGCSLKLTPESENLPPGVLNSQWQKISTYENSDFRIRATAKLLLEMKGRRIIQQAGMVMASPTSLYVEVAPPIGLPSLFLSINDGTMMVYASTSGIAYKGRATPDNLERFLGVGLSVEHLTYALIGKAGALAKTEELKGEVIDGRHHRLDVLSATGRRRYWVDPELGRLSRSEIFAGQELLYLLEFKDYRRVGNRELPHVIEILSSGQDETSLRIEYLDVQQGKEGEAAPTLSALPPGVKVIYLD